MIRPEAPALAVTTLLTVLAFALVLLSVNNDRGEARAAGVYPSTTLGYDISWPQCGRTYPAPPYAFGIVGVTGGRAFYTNPCLASEFAWADGGLEPPSLYTNLNYPAGTTSGNGDTGPAGNCSRRDNACRAYNYGYNAATHAVGYAASQGASATVWWLDIETGNTWSKKTGDNAKVIQGAIDSLRSRGITVGIYSTRYQFTKIAGSYSPGLPIWIAGATSASSAAAICANGSYWFAGGSPWLVQYIKDGLDHNHAC